MCFKKDHSVENSLVIANVEDYRQRKEIIAEIWAHTEEMLWN